MADRNSPAFGQAIVCRRCPLSSPCDGGGPARWVNDVPRSLLFQIPWSGTIMNTSPEMRSTAPPEVFPGQAIFFPSRAKPWSPLAETSAQPGSCPRAEFSQRGESPAVAASRIRADQQHELVFIGWSLGVPAVPRWRFENRQEAVSPTDGKADPPMPDLRPPGRTGTTGTNRRGTADVAGRRLRRCLRFGLPAGRTPVPRRIASPRSPPASSPCRDRPR